ncbi:hypothetical protein [Microbacterium sp. 3J1]|uniref:hypothetical protein n=1 Tax=Microbacterium sp. 3J1 TaxID=861269 RepID=UPI000ABCD520|nr:hypothetical protein [Microbacterium sp. 3J1]
MLGPDGWYSDYRRPPANLAPEPSAPPSTAKPSDIDGSWLALVLHWRIVVAELMERGVDLYDPAVRARPWPGVRTLIFSLLDTSPRLRAALRKGNDAEADDR